MINNLISNSKLTIPTWEYLNLVFDPMYYMPCSEYTEGTVLYTLDGRNWTNATILNMVGADQARILTDIGNVLTVSISDLEQRYHKPTKKRPIGCSCNAS